MRREPNGSRAAGHHAVVIGGSMAGLLAARVLADHFERVTLVERDRFSDGATPRPGVPQGQHPHALLAKGLEIFRGLFLGIDDSLREGGAVFLDIGADVRWYHFGGYKVRFKSDLVGPFLSRPFLEAEVRRRVLALRNLTAIEECAVKALVGSSDGGCVRGVKIERRGAGGSEETLAADLVVDAAGRGSQSPRWLEALGYSRPPESVVRVNVSYTSRLYRRRPEDLQGASAVYLLPTPPHEKRTAAIFPIEGDRWIVMLGGWAGHHAPTDEQGFLEFARTLPTPDVYDVIRRAEPLTAPALFKFPSNLRRHYEKMTRFPERYLAFGDALCSFNPIYGQGMTASALYAMTLDSCLQEQRGDLGGLPQRFFRRAARVIERPWGLATGEDFRYPEVEGPRPPGLSLINWYVEKVHRATHHDPAVYRAFLNAMNLTHPPSTLFTPSIIFRLIKGNLTPKRAAAHAALTPVNVRD